MVAAVEFPEGDVSTIYLQFCEGSKSKFHIVGCRGDRKIAPDAEHGINSSVSG